MVYLPTYFNNLTELKKCMQILKMYKKNMLNIATFMIKNSKQLIF